MPSLCSQWGSLSMYTSIFSLSVMSSNHVASSSFRKNCILTQDRPSQESSPPPHTRSRQLPDPSSSLTYPACLSFPPIPFDEVRLVFAPRSDSQNPHPSFAGDSLTRSVISSIKLEWGRGHQESLSKFQTVPNFVNNMSFPFPIFSSTLLFERSTLINSGIFSSNRPRLYPSLSVGPILLIFSVQYYNNVATSIFI